MKEVHLPQAKLLYAVSALTKEGNITQEESIRLKGNSTKSITRNDH